MHLFDLPSLRASIKFLYLFFFRCILFQTFPPKDQQMLNNWSPNLVQHPPQRSTSPKEEKKRLRKDVVRILVGQRRANILKDALSKEKKPSSLETQKLTRAPGGRKGCLQGDPRRSPRGSRVDACRSLRLRTCLVESLSRVARSQMETGLGWGWGNGPGSSRQLASKLELGD